MSILFRIVDVDFIERERCIIVLNYEDKKINELLCQVDGMLKNKSKHSKYNISDNLSSKAREVLMEIDANHNNSISVELILNNIDNFSNVAIFYRGVEITYKQLFSRAFEYANSLKKMGFSYGSEIPVCMENTPEFVYLLIAINMIGAKINSFGEWFNEDYTKFILEHSNSKYLFVTDSQYEKIKDKIGNSIDNIVMFSLRDSFLNDINPYEEIDNKFHKINNNVDYYKNNVDNMNILNSDEFINLGLDNNLAVVYDSGLDDEATITYTSGTTTPGHPKAVVNVNRSYVTLARFKNNDVSGMPSMKNLRVLAHIPTYTHMEISCGIFDTLYQGCTLCLEPFYDEKFFPYALVINKPNCTYGSVGFNKNLCDKLNFSDEFKDEDFSQLMLAFITGEFLSIGEEKYFNYTSRKHGFGKAKLPFPLAPITYSIGGGTTEFSGSMVTLFKEMQSKLLKPFLHNMPLGLMPLKFNEMQVLNEDGDYCEIGEPGMIVGKSPCIMKGYYYDQNLARNSYVYDKYGYKWFSLGTIGYKSDKYGRIAMKGRPDNYILMHDLKKIYFYQIEDIIAKDTKNIMSCSIVKVKNDYDKDCYVCHIMFQPFKQNSVGKVIDGCMQRLMNEIPDEVLESLYIRIRNADESFEVAPSGKRNNNALILEGVNEKCYSVSLYKSIVGQKNINSMSKKLQRIKKK